jgi:hypothetical protein
VNSPLAGDHGAMFDWFAAARENHGDICCGFELDTKEAVPPVSAVHFQPRRHQELVRPFCETIGEPEKAELYLEMAQRMPQGWPLSFFGLFRGRPGSPLRVCGYLDPHEKEACANHSAHLASVFDQIGFRAYDDQMLAQVGKLMAAAPSTVDFQFDVYPDGSLGDTFAIDMQFGIQQPEAVWQAFSSGAGADVMGILECLGAADDRWKRSVRATFARAIPVELPDGGIGRFALTVMPQWVKARWIRGTLQPSKLYMLVNAALVNG